MAYCQFSIRATRNIFLNVRINSFSIIPRCILPLYTIAHLSDMNIYNAKSQLLKPPLPLKIYIIISANCINAFRYTHYTITHAYLIIMLCKPSFNTEYNLNKKRSHQITKNSKES